MSELNDLITQLCPDGVPYKKLGDLCVSGNKGMLKKNELIPDGKYPVVNGGMNYYGRYNQYNNDKDCFVFSSRGSAGYVSYQRAPFYAAALCYPFMSSNENIIMTRFMYFFLKQNEAKNIDKLVAKGSIPALNKADVLNIEIPVPPLPVQEEVVRILDSFTTLEAELEAELADRKKQYEYYRDYLLDKNTLEKIDGTAIETKRLDEVFDSFNGMGGVSNKWDDDGNCQFIDYKNVYNNTKVDVSNTPYATVKKISNQRAIKQGDILCTCASEVPNECALSAVVEDNIRDNIFLDDHLFGLRVKEEYADLVNTTYINYYFTTFEHRKNVFKAVHGVTRYYIDTKAFMRIPVPLPSLATQERVVGILDRFDALTTSLTDGIPAEIAMRREQYEYYRSRLLDFPHLPDGSASVSDSE